MSHLIYYQTTEKVVKFKECETHMEAVTKFNHFISEIADYLTNTAKAIFYEVQYGVFKEQTRQYVVDAFIEILEKLKCKNQNLNEIIMKYFDFEYIADDENEKFEKVIDHLHEFKELFEKFKENNKCQG
jgi:hypothetical protein